MKAGETASEPSRKGKLSLGWSGKGCCEDTKKIHVSVRGVGWGHFGGEAGGKKRVNRGRESSGKFKSSSKGGHPFIQPIRLERALPQNNFYLGRGLACSRRSQRAERSWNRLQFDLKLK